VESGISVAFSTPCKLFSDSASTGHSVLIPVREVLYGNSDNETLSLIYCLIHDLSF